MQTRRAQSGHASRSRSPTTPQSAQTSGTTMVRPVTNSKSREEGFSRITRSHGKRKLSWKYRAYRLLKHMLAHQIAYVERDLAVVFDGAFAIRFRDKRAVWQPLACGDSLPPRLWLGGYSIGSLVLYHAAPPRLSLRRLARSGFCSFCGLWSPEDRIDSPSAIPYRFDIPAITLLPMRFPTAIPGKL